MHILVTVSDQYDGEEKGVALMKLFLYWSRYVYIVFTCSQPLFQKGFSMF